MTFMFLMPNHSKSTKAKNFFLMMCENDRLKGLWVLKNEKNWNSC